MRSRPERQSHGPHRRDRLEDQLTRRKRLRDQQHHHRRQKHQKGRQKNRRRPPLNARGNPTVPDGDPVPVGDVRPEDQRQHGRRRRLDAARRTADEHPDQRNQHGRTVQSAEFDRIESGRAQRHRLKNRVVKFRRRRKSGQHPVPLQHQKRQRADSDQPGGRGQRQMRPHRHRSTAQTVRQQHGGGRSNSAEHNQNPHRVKQKRRILIGGQIARTDRESRVAESGNSGKNSLLQREQQLPVMQVEEERQNHRPRGLHSEGIEKDQLERFHEVALLGIGHRTHQMLLPQTQPSPHHMERDRRDTHDAESAELNQQQQKKLADAGDVRTGVDHRQTGHTHRAGCGERRIQR